MDKVISFGMAEKLMLSLKGRRCVQLYSRKAIMSTNNATKIHDALNKRKVLFEQWYFGIIFLVLAGGLLYLHILQLFLRKILTFKLPWLAGGPWTLEC